MTAVAAVLIAGTPALVGDVVLTDREGKRIDHAGKVYVVAPNVALGWSRNASLAVLALTRLREELSDGRIVSTEDLKRALDNLEDLRGRQNEDLDLTGWIVTPVGSKVVRWSSFHRPTMFCGEASDIGDGGGALRKMLATPVIGEGNTVGYDEAPMKVISGFLEARFEEALGGDDWPRTWGGAYDAIVYQEGFFRWLGKLTYVGWDVVLDSEDRITEVTQAPVVFTQEHVHGCTLMLAKRVGDGETDVKISYPIDRDFDLDWLDWYLLAARVDELDGHWLELHCGCGARVFYPAVALCASGCRGGSVWMVVVSGERGEGDPRRSASPSVVAGGRSHQREVAAEVAGEGRVRRERQRDERPRPSRC